MDEQGQRGGYSIKGLGDMKSLNDKLPRPTDADMAAENARLFKEADRRRKHAEALRDIGLSLTATHEPQQLLDRIAEEARQLTGSTFTFVAIPQKPHYKFVAVAGDDHGYRHILKLSDDATSPYGHGPLGRAIRSRAPVICEDVLTDPLFLPWKDIAFGRGIRSLVAVPILLQEKPYGAILTYAPITKAYDAETINLLTSLAAQAAVALENSRLYQESKKQQDIQKFLKELSQDITHLDIDSLIKKLVEKVRELFKVDQADVSIQEWEKWHIKGLAGNDSDVVPSIRLGVGRGRSRWIFENRKALMIPDITQDKETASGETIKSLGIRGYLGVPLFYRGAEIIGVLRALSYQPREFTQEEVDLLQQLANEAVIAIENARLYVQTKEQALQLERRYIDTVQFTALQKPVGDIEGR